MAAEALAAAAAEIGLAANCCNSPTMLKIAFLLVDISFARALVDSRSWVTSMEMVGWVVAGVDVEIGTAVAILSYL